MPDSVRDRVEAFHLAFLRVLTSGADRGHYIVKGGCNLRFWFGSIRYSEDIDLDVVVTARATLKNKIDRLLAGAALQSVLRARGLTIAGVSAPKQTDTTQRWKVALEAQGGSSLHTKIEFSRSGASEGHAFEPIDAALARRHRILAPLAEHYLAPAAIGQKVSALAHRSETQARDVFDLHLLFSKAASPRLDADSRREIPTAIERVMDVSFSDFRGHVIAFLEPEHVALYGSREVWNQMQSEVIAALEALAP